MKEKIKHTTLSELITSHELIKKIEYFISLDYPIQYIKSNLINSYINNLKYKNLNNFKKDIDYIANKMFLLVSALRSILINLELFDLRNNQFNDLTTTIGELTNLSTYKCKRGVK